MEVNPAYSSKLGNLLWGWPLLIPDPACAAVELGRRFLQGDPKSSERTNGGNRRKEERQAQALQDAEARAEWKRVWNQLHPQSGDTPRCTLLALRQRFPEACPSPSPFKAPQSLVSRLEPARIASDLRIHMSKVMTLCILDQVTLSFRGANLPRKTVNRLHKKLQSLDWSKLLTDELKEFPEVEVVDESGG
jgi:hypothetical protein